MKPTANRNEGQTLEDRLRASYQRRKEAGQKLSGRESWVRRRLKTHALGFYVVNRDNELPNFTVTAKR